MTERAVGTLRREIEQHEPTRGKRYEKQLQDRVIAYAQERRSASASWKTIATELGLKFETVRRWCIVREPPRPETTLRRVEIIESTSRPALALVTPAGYRVEGLTLDGAAILVRALG